jgi:hypothetical protein
VDGLLVRPFDSAERWADVLSRAAANPAVIRGLARHVRRPRQSDECADEMLAIYERLVGHRAFAAES